MGRRHRRTDDVDGRDDAPGVKGRTMAPAGEEEATRTDRGEVNERAVGGASPVWSQTIWNQMGAMTKKRLR